MSETVSSIMGVWLSPIPTEDAVSISIALT